MEESKKIGQLTLVLAAVAGYCDTVTFVTADTIFSAHVTGNFVVFAYQVINAQDANAWIKLITFPTFILSVMAGGRAAADLNGGRNLLLIEGLVLLAAGISWWLLNIFFRQPPGIYPLVMCVVVAMGLQNAFNKLFAREIYGPTTMMTGNVTQASLDFGNLLKYRFKDLQSRQNIRKGLVLIGGFLIGCILGALLGKAFGFGTVALAGITVIICYRYTAA
ncbi:YoaK family protein [Mucilaginibacter celer]|uniref:DUF1275 domain-containing protein n=1 Tax=Mucilaginibacter celer TaxID=2305508 RepID=A0A494VQA1_9SPHI|nr:YoaK family protein [Mucilaginibacter celer]AYL95400.1 DUF1275 domain-containing protein [Mucilaginibacter celer]